MDIKWIAGGVAVFAAGVGTGILATRKYFEKAYAEVAEDEIREARDFYSKVNKAEYPTPGDAVKGLHPEQASLDEAAEALVAYKTGEPKLLKDGEVTGVSLLTEGSFEPPPEVMNEFRQYNKPTTFQAPQQNNIFTDAEQINQLRIEDRNPNHPYVITMDEYTDNDVDHSQVAVTYYAGDGVVADERDDRIELVDKIFGKENLSKFGIGSEDKDVVLIRNEVIKMDYEVTYSDGHYAREVLGLDEELRHADDIPRRRRPRWDDE